MWFSLALGIFVVTALDTVGQRRIDLESERLQLEVAKLGLEVEKLQKDRAELPAWVTGTIAGLLGGLLGTGATVWIARKTRRGELEKAVHDKRLESYPKLVWAGAPLAVYFPNVKESTPVDPEQCHQIGENLSRWYFSGGGLLLSIEARNAYFKLARALTRAANSNRLWCPTFPADADDISLERLREYRALLSRQNDLNDVENWCFGADLAETTAAHRFRDYVFLQELASQLRSQLAEDLGARRRPS